MRVKPNLRRSLADSLAAMAESCLSMRDLKRIYARAIVAGLIIRPVVLGKIFRFAAVSPSGDLRFAHLMFDQMAQPNTFFYNTLIRGHSKSSSPSNSVRIFNQMRLRRVDPDEFTLTFLLKARARTATESATAMAWDEIHGAALKLGFGSHLFVCNAVIHLYAARGAAAASRRVFAEMAEADVVSWSGLVLAHARAGELDNARRVFDEMPDRDVVSWTAMISGYLQGRRPREALELFWEMIDAGVGPDEVTMLSVVSACASLGDLETGIATHRYIDDSGFGWMVSLCNALIGMYSKCGCLSRAWQVFNNMRRRSLITWNSMISACANHGNVGDAFGLFQSMIGCGVSPDGFTFLGLLVGYARIGLVDDGYRLFESMQRDYGIQASVEHYGCMVDMLGKAGRLEEAHGLVTSMPMPSDEALWESLLAACKHYGNVDIGERVTKRLLELNPDGGYNYNLQEIYATAGQREETKEVERNFDFLCRKLPIQNFRNISGFNSLSTLA